MTVRYGNTGGFRPRPQMVAGPAKKGPTPSFGGPMPNPPLQMVAAAKKGPSPPFGGAMPFGFGGGPGMGHPLAVGKAASSFSWNGTEPQREDPEEDEKTSAAAVRFRG